MTVTLGGGLPVGQLGYPNTDAQVLLAVLVANGRPAGCCAPTDSMSRRSEGLIHGPELATRDSHEVGRADWATNAHRRPKQHAIGCKLRTSTAV